MWPSCNGESDDVSAKRSACQASARFPSTLEMHCLMDVGLCGGAIESAWIRPREGSPGSKTNFDGISELMPYSR